MSVTPARLAAALLAMTAEIVLVGCATPKSEWKPAGYYVTNRTIFGCDSFEGSKGTPVKQAAILSLQLQRRLLTLLDRAAATDEKLKEELDNYRDQPMCWYETPEKDVQLTLGSFCDGQFQLEFHRHDEEWGLISFGPALVECLPVRSR